MASHLEAPNVVPIANNRDLHFEVKESPDLMATNTYQLYAYGHKYLTGGKNLMLIYTMGENFTMSFPVFTYKGGLELFVVPFDLMMGKLLY